MKILIPGRPVPANNIPSVNSESDIERGRAMFRFLCPNSNFMKYMVIPGEPYSKARPRFTKSGKVYSPQKQKDNEEFLSWHFRNNFKEPLTSNLAVGCIFYRSNHQRIDVDNMLKNVMDAANGIIYVDDCQVTAKLGIVEFDSKNPRTVIVIGEHDSTLERFMDKSLVCPTCKQRFEARTPFWVNKTKFCSRECASHSRGENLKSLVRCLNCKKEFKRKTSAQKYCSEACRIDIFTLKNKSKRIHPEAKCRECGGKVSRPEYVRCRKCWNKSF